MLRPVTTQGAEPRVSAYYWAPVPIFLSADPASVLGVLAASHTFALEEDQRAAWEEEIEILRSALVGVNGTLFLEFHVPRFGRPGATMNSVARRGTRFRRKNGDATSSMRTVSC
jgi:hypothetical protein